MIRNALEASPRGGVVTVMMRVAYDRLHIAVSDEGDGIPEGVRARVFEPFFTTKSGRDHGGIGLGLSVCRSLVESMGGSIIFKTEIGKGTVFAIDLPLKLATKEAVHG